MPLTKEEKENILNISVKIPTESDQLRTDLNNALDIIDRLLNDYKGFVPFSTTHAIELMRQKAKKR